MPARFYITTPIYYVNALPHVGTAYTTIAADALARYHRLRGHDARFVTGTDEHGQKIERVARERGATPLEHATEVAERFKQMWPRLNIAPDDFIRTTEPRHAARVADLWRRIRDRGDIYLGEYEGWYCVADEAFYTEKELKDGLSPTGRPVERVRESSYFFRLSRYTDVLLDFYERHPEFVQPEGRYNEVKSFVRGGLQDLSVSRTTFKWGIPVPDDPSHVMYVWFDALTNYWSALGPDGDPLQRFWPPDVHLVGKEIVRFHAVYWPAFLLAAGLPESQLPRRVFAHGWLTSGGQKITKTPSPGAEAPPAAGPAPLRVTQLDPARIAEEVGADVLRYYLLRAISFGQDGDFSLNDLVGRLNADLANDLGNLLNRTLGLCSKLTEGKVPSPGEAGELERALWDDALQASVKARESFDAFAPHRALEAIWRLCSQANTYVDQAAPWAAAKKGDKARVGTILATLLEVLRWLGVLIAPVMPERADELRRQLGLAPLASELGADRWPVEWSPRPEGEALSPGQPLFPRVDDEQRQALLERLGRAPGEPAAAPSTPASNAASAQGGGAPAPAAAPAQGGGAPAPAAAPAQGGGAPAPAAASVEAPSPPVTYDEFAKTDLRVGLVVSAAKVPKKDKLLDLRVDLGEPEPRRIVAGLALSFAPEALVGRRVVVVANLAPRDFGKGLVSHGMILAAGPSEALSLPAVDERIAPGTRVK
jgi:methionyl-tRNA synthetase